jgi:alkylhydroperoxidase family enzyme
MTRAPYLTSATAPPESSDVLAKLEDRGLDMRLLRAVANSPGALRNFARLGNSLIRHTSLAPRLRELVILDLSIRTNAPYEWFEHEPMAMQAGLTAEEIAAVQAQSPGKSATLSDGDRHVLEFARAVVERRVDDELWSASVESLGLEATADLVLAASWWGAMVPTVVDGLGVDQADDHG